MIIFYAFFNLVIGDLCCFDPWTEWQQSSLTCGKVCRLRKRNLFHGIILPHYVGYWCYGKYPNGNYVTCPLVEEYIGSCETIVCREYDFKIKLFEL